MGTEKERREKAVRERLTIDFATAFRDPEEQPLSYSARCTARTTELSIPQYAQHISPGNLIKKYNSLIF